MKQISSSQYILGPHCRGETLPPLSKKIIYIDQFALSYMVRALHPEMKATGNSEADYFWLQLYQKLDKLIKMQIIICPQSHFHLAESIVSNFFEPLEAMYQLLSRGFQFPDQSQIKKQQLKESVLNWLGNSTKHNYSMIGSYHTVFNQNINSWLPKTFHYKPTHYSPAYKDALRKSRERIHQQWIREFCLWKEETRIRFEQWKEIFYLSLLKEILSSHPDYRKYINMLPAQPHYNIKLGYFLIESIEVIEVIHSVFQEEGIGREALELNTWHYLQSESFRQIPFLKLYALFYASFARKGGSGQKSPPDRGTTNDLNMLSLLLPYCDAMFIDNQCRSSLEEKDVRDNIDYKTKVFSLNNKEEFLAYLESLEEDFLLTYRKKVEEIYGAKWINTPTQLYK